MVELLALGSLELWHEQQRHALGSVKELCVLAVLVHARGEPVTVDTLMDRVWDGDPPPTAVGTMQTYLSRLRRRLHHAVGDLAGIDRPSPRLYRLLADPEDIDLLRFQRLRKAGTAAAGRGEREAAISLLHTAEGLWRGEPLAEFTGSWTVSARARLIEDHRRVREERIRLELELGRHADLIGELREMASQNPLAQKVVASLMLALYRSGRHDEALTLYRTTHRRLHEEQGIEPRTELQELHRRILDQDRTLMETHPGAVASAAAPGSRNNLPRDTRDFTGRTGELRILLSEPVSDNNGTKALPLTVIHGMPGVGKTALAIHAAHQLSSSYPDGSFYVDLHAYSGHPPHEPAEALAVLLRATGSSGELPASLDERVARWREWTARHRALVVLDNAKDAAQASPLLPGTPTCRAIVTSRNRLAGLEGATSLFVDVLSGAEAATLFTRVAGAARLAPDSEALGQVVDACGCHPLALQMTASHYRHRDSWDLRHLLDRLTQAADPLDEFDAAVTSAFRLTYAELSTPAQTLFRRVALHPGPDITLRAATALAGPETGTNSGTKAWAGSVQVRRSLEELLDCHLLEEPVRDRYRLHDLARAFGLQICIRTEPEPTRQEAVDRLLAYHLTTAHRADRLANPNRRALPLPPERISPHAIELADPDEASVWLTVERANILAVARTAAAERPDYAALFPHVLAKSLKTWGTWDIAAELYRAAVPALRANGDRAALARTLMERADVLAQKGHDEALRCATEALSLFRDLDDPHGCADALFQSGRAHLAAGQHDTGLRLVDQSLGLYRVVHDRHGEAECLNLQGMVLSRAGQYNEAIRKVRAMHDIYEEMNDLYGVAQALNNEGELHALQGRDADARDCYERSLVLMRRRGGRQQLAILETNLGALNQATGQTALALACFQRALDSHRAGGDTLGEANVLINMGTAYAETQRRDKALLHFNLAEKVARGIDNPYERQRALIGVADVQRDSGRFDIALRVYEQALDVARSIEFPLGCAHALAGLARTTLFSHRIELARQYGREAIALYQSLEAEAEAEGLRRLLRATA
ncbi:AfsR/SARP family transcriptional regulator [Streptomyces sp. NPDC088400]|uniref:AfsR/SARP family transcriptional regulator n=1 Tax=Streptomyces sp. NPDC088400 TaxID=3365861 RepID=UPI00381DA917